MLVFLKRCAHILYSRQYARLLAFVLEVLTTAAMTLSDGFPPFYASRPTAVFYDIKLAYLIYTAIALFLGVLLVLPGVRGKDVSCELILLLL